MPMPIKVTGKRVKAGDLGYRPLDGMGGVSTKYPVDGFVFTMNIPGAVPIYVTDCDAEKLEGHPTNEEVQMMSWGGKGRFLKKVLDNVFWLLVECNQTGGNEDVCRTGTQEGKRSLVLQRDCQQHTARR